MRYIFQKLRAIKRLEGENHEDYLQQPMVEDINLILNHYAQRIQQISSEDNWTADLICRIFLALLDHTQIKFNQKQLNVARDSLIPLLELARFEKRYIIYPPWESF